MALLKASRKMLPVFSMKETFDSSSSPADIAAPSREGSRSRLMAIERRVPEKDRTRGIMVGVDLSSASIHFLDGVSNSAVAEGQLRETDLVSDSIFRAFWRFESVGKSRT